MRLRVTTPMETVVDEADVEYVHAEDETGAFGVRRGHADFITVLTECVIYWRVAPDREGHVAVRGGVFVVVGGRSVEVATREAVQEEKLSALLRSVHRAGAAEAASRASQRGHVQHLHLAAVNRICRYLRADVPAVPRVNEGREP